MDVIVPTCFTDEPVSPDKLGKGIMSSKTNNDQQNDGKLECEKNPTNQPIIMNSDDKNIDAVSNTECSNGKKGSAPKLSLIDSDSELSEGEQPTSSMEQLQTSKTNDEVENDTENIDLQKEKQSSKVFRLIDSDSDDNDEPEDNKEQFENKSHESIHSTKNLSNKVSLNETIAIQSEQQRLHREARISVPYHKPKKRTLEEFLRRRTIVKPVLSDNDSATSTLIDMAIRKKSSKMNSEELEIYAQLMEERAKECSEFFKSDSEEDEIFQTNDGVHDINVEEGDDVPITKVLNEDNAQMDEPMKNIESEKPTDVQQLTEEDLEDILYQEDLLSKSSASIKNTESSNTYTDAINKTPSINIKKLLLKNRHYTSSLLSVNSNTKFIDLDIDIENAERPEETGVHRLMSRLIETKERARNSVAGQKDTPDRTKLSASVTENKELVYTGSKPGEAHFKLKLDLKEIITKKRLELLKKKHDNIKLDDEFTCNKDEEEDEEDTLKEASTSDDILNDNEEEGLHNVKEQEIRVDDEENIEMEHVSDNDESSISESNDLVNNKEENDEEENDEDENDEDENENDEDENCDSEENICTDKNNMNIKNRIIKPCGDSDSDNDDINFLRTQILSSPKRLSVNDAVKESVVLSDVEKSQKPLSPIISQIPIIQNDDQQCWNINRDKQEEELMELCSGSFSTQTQVREHVKENSSCNMNSYTKRLSSEDDDSEKEEHNAKENVDEQQHKLKRLKKKKQKKCIKLGFSDDEDESEEVCDNEIAEEENNEEEEAEEEDLIGASMVAYNSEESLIEMTKDECLKEAENFFEKEAELSDSEWDSADEDENNLDCYDLELGDEDEFDQKELRSELGKIHARKMLDEDIRAVRKIREIFFEDEEEENGLRQRQFRWKNVEGNFNVDDIQQQDNDDNSNMTTNEKSEEQINADELIRRKMRYEREQYLEKHKIEGFTDCVDSNDKETGKLIQKITKNNILCMKTSASASTSTECQTRSSFLIAKDVNFRKYGKSARESFLLRGQDILQKVANLSKDNASSTLDVDNNITTLTINTNKPKNFTFAMLTVEEHAKLKRKSCDILNKSDEQQEDDAQCIKKSKTERPHNKCLIDQLL